MTTSTPAQAHHAAHAHHATPAFQISSIGDTSVRTGMHANVETNKIYPSSCQYRFMWHKLDA